MQETSAPPRRLWHWVNLVAMLLLLGMFMLLLWQPLYLAPPHTAKTAWLYLGLLLLWAVFLLIFGRWRGQRYTAGHPIALLAGLLLTCILCAVLRPPAPVMLLANFDCDPAESLPNDRVRYRCHYESLEGRSDYVLEGREGWPLLRLVHQKMTGY